MIGKFIQKLRKEKNMTQKELADKLYVTENTIGNWENGRRLPDYSILKELCEILDTNVNELLSGKRILSCILKTRSVSLGPCSISLVSCLRVQSYEIFCILSSKNISRTTLCNVIQRYAMLYQTFCAFSLVISRIFSTFAVN